MQKTEHIDSSPNVPSHISSYLLSDLDKLQEHVKKILSEGTDLYYYDESLLLPLFQYLLGQKETLPEELSSVANYSELLQSLLGSLHFPAHLEPFRQVIENGPVRLTSFLDSFFVSPSESISGNFFAMLQKSVLGRHITPKNIETTAIPIINHGMIKGVVFYFANSQNCMIARSKAVDPLGDQTVLDDIEAMYQHFEKEFEESGTLLTYLYAKRTNSFYLSGPRYPWSDKCDSVFLETIQGDIKEYYSQKMWRQRTPIAKILPHTSLGKEELRIQFLAEVTSHRIFDTQKHYAIQFLLKGLGKNNKAQLTRDKLYKFFFESITLTTPSSATLLWVRSQNNGLLKVQYAEYYKRNAEDREVSIYQEHTEIIRNHLRFQAYSELVPSKKEAWFADLTSEQKKEICYILGYNHDFDFPPQINCKSHLQIPLTVIHEGLTQDIVVEFFFATPKENIFTIEYDLVRLINRAMRIAIDELKIQEAIRKSSQAEAKALEYRAQAHEVKNLIPFIKKETPAAILTNISTFFATLFAVSKGEAEKLKTGYRPLSIPQNFASGASFKNFLLSAAEIALKIEHSIKLCNDLGATGFADSTEDTIESLLKKKVQNDIHRFVFDKSLEKAPHLDIVLSELDLYSRWYFCSALIVALRNVIQHSHPKSTPITFSIDLNKNQLVIRNQKTILIGRTKGEKQAKAWPGSTAESIKFCVGEYGGKMIEDGFLVQGGWLDDRKMIYLYNSLIPLPPSFISRTELIND